ncbi:MAG: hypothetical protein ACOX7N_09240 [Lawsonibacter sp.]|jgi:hypothetical protein
MKQKTSRWLRPLLFVLGGMMVGYLYYRLVGCASGSCVLTSNPIRSTIYMGVVGWLLSIVLEKKPRNGDRGS